MFWQREYLRENVAMTLNSTYRLELPDHGLLGSLLLRISGSQVSGYGQGMADWRIIDRITKLEVILNGSTICKSIPGYIAQALAVFDQGVMPPDTWRNYATNTQFCYILINFGRKLFDPGMMLDLSQFHDVELRVTNDATSSQFSDLTISVLAEWLREGGAVPLGGYMRTEEWRSWTTVAAETKYLELPTEWLIRRIILQAIPAIDSDFVEKTNMANLMETIKLALHTGEKLVYEGGIDDIMRENFLHYGKEYLVACQPYMLADDGVDLSLGYVIGAVGGAGSQDGAGAATVATIESGRTSFTQKPETYEADSPINLIARGISPYLTVLLPFDLQDDPTTWLDPAARATVKLDITTRNASSAADGTNKVILDRFVRY